MSKQNNTDLKYEQVMRLKSMWKSSHLLSPKVLSIDTFKFPIDSVIHWFKVSQTIDNPSNQVGYLKNNKLVVETVLRYPEEGTIGKYTPITSPNAATLIKDASKLVKEYKWLRPLEVIKVTPKVGLLYNYGSLLTRYKYSEQILRRYNMYYNSAVTMMDRLLLTKRHIFLVLDLPSKLLSRRELDRCATKLTNNLLNTLPTTAYFNLLELWKFLSPAMHRSSVFSTLVPYKQDKRDEVILPGRLPYLDRSQWSRINLLLVVDSKCILVNLNLLMSFIEEWGIINKTVTPMKYKQFTIKFLDMLQFVIDNAALTEEELEEHANNDFKQDRLKPDEVIAASTISKQITDINTVPVPDTTLSRDDDINTDLDYGNEITDMMLPDSDEFDNTDTSEEYKDHDFDTETLTGIELGDDLILDKDFKSLDELINQEFTYSLVNDKLENLRNNRSISKQKYDKLKKTLEDQPEKKSPYKDMKDTKLKDILDDKKDNYDSSKKDMEITDNVTVFDKSYNKNTMGTLTKDYIRDQYKKDIIRTAYSLQNSNVIVEDYEINEIDSILGTIEEHTIKINSLDGSPSTIKINLPKIEENGDVKISSNTYKIRSQKADKPIRKINFNTVMLSSYYGKVSVLKAKTNYDNIGYWLMNTVVKLTNIIDIKNLVLLPIKNPDVKLPLDYTHFSRFIKSFTFKDMDFLFDYANRGSLFKNMTDKDMEDIEDGVVIIGAKGNTPIVMDFENRVYLYNKNSYKEIDNLYDMLSIDKSTSPIEYITVKVVKKDIPAVILLSYYIGLEELFRLLKVKYTKHDKKVRDIHKYNQYLIEFKDTYLLVERDHGKADLILSGLLSIEKILKDIPLQVFNDKSAYSIVLTRMNLPILYFNEIKLMETMFVDPMTLTLLKQLGEPTNFKGLIIRAAELLVDDNYISSGNADGVVIRGYERVAGLMYKELVTALKDHENRTFFSKSKVTVNPFSVMNKITEDSTTVLSDDLNPIASIKQSEDVSSLGAFGRGKESMAKDTRAIDETEIGIISEASKDSGDVGITSYLTANPNIANTRGIIEKQKEIAWANLLSTNSLIAPFALTDDVKRLNFSSIQASHVVPINEMRVPYVRTGYESIIPIKAGNKFAIVAEDNGKVIKVDKSSMKVKYDKQGEKTYKIISWTTKEESETCYTHVMVPNLQEGDKFIKDDTLIYDSLFFEPDIFNKKRVVYKQGSLVTVALMEDSQTHEDSAGISRELNTRLGTNITKVKSIIVSADDTILNMVKPGDKLEPSSILFTITDSIVTNKKLDPEVLKTLENIKSNSPKAKVRGVVDKIVIMYNTELDNVSDSLYDLIKESDRRLKITNGNTGRVNAGYSVRGVSLVEGQVEIKIYIKVQENMGIGDKAILGNQMKFTVGDVFESDMITEDGTKIDAIFALRSIAARIVNSCMLMGTTGMVLEKLQDKVVDMYFK